MATIVDSYSEGNQDNFITLSSDVGDKQGAGQSFTCTIGGTLYSAKFYLKKYGSPTGTAVAKIYSHSGTYGTSSVPNSLLATSDTFDVSTLSAVSFVLKEFIFSSVNKITLSNSTYYVVTIEYSGGDSSKEVEVGYDNSSSTHDGNQVYLYSGTWYGNGGVGGADTCFYVYKDDATTTSTSSTTTSSSTTISTSTTTTLPPIIIKTDKIGIIQEKAVSPRQYPYSSLPGIRGVNINTGPLPTIIQTDKKSIIQERAVSPRKYPYSSLPGITDP